MLRGTFQNRRVGVSDEASTQQQQQTTTAAAGAVCSTSRCWVDAGTACGSERFASQLGASVIKSSRRMLAGWASSVATTERSRSKAGGVRGVRCGPGLAHPEEEAAESTDLPDFLSVPPTGMAKGLGSSGSATLERSKLNLKREVQTSEPKLDYDGGGSDIGKIIFNEGGGDGDDGDDDDYFFDDGEEGDGDGDDGFFRKVLPQLYDRLSISAVLEEWFRSFSDLPVILRRAVEMGLFSSAQLVRFCSMDMRPNIARALSRKLPLSVSRGFVGRMMGDPAFAQKLAWENLLAVGFSLAFEARARGPHFWDELDLVAIDTLGLAAATTSLVWLMAPNRSFGSARKFPWQKMLESLPNHVFDASGPQRNYTRGSRLVSLFAKCGELAAMGAIAGAATAALSRAASTSKGPAFEPSVPLLGVGRSAAGMAAFFGLHAHLRYQALGGIDRYLFEHSAFLWSYLLASAMFRAANVGFGETVRPMWQGFMPLPPSRAVDPDAPPLECRSNVLPLPEGVRKTIGAGKEAAAQQGPKAKKRKAKGYELSVVAGNR